MHTAISHTNFETRSADRLPATFRNGIVRSFVASRKKYLFFKRVFDITAASVVILAVMSWLLPVIAMLIKLHSKGPVFFLQKRVGRNGKPFQCIKFRTMVQNEEADERPAEENDERITRIGKFLRLTNLDELPQFFNVWLGNMSIVGPRPHMIADCIRFSFVISSYSFRSYVRPGITGWAQVNGYHGPTADYESIIIRYYWDAQYVRKLSFWLDLKIMTITITQSIGNLLRIFLKLFRGRKKTMVIGRMEDRNEIVREGS